VRLPAPVALPRLADPQNRAAPAPAPRRLIVELDEDEGEAQYVAAEPSGAAKPREDKGGDEEADEEDPAGSGG
jgi:hypothetical protein